MKVAGKKDLAARSPAFFQRRNITIYAAPNTQGARVAFKPRYNNYINGEFAKRNYFENPSPVDGKTFTKVARSMDEDIEWELDAYPAHAAFGGHKQSGIGRENHKMMLDH